MCSSNLKSSFNIDDILCQSATASRSSVSVSATRGAFTDQYSSSMTGQTQFIPTLFDLIPPRYYFPHGNPYPTPAPPPPGYIDPYALNVFQKATPSGYMPYYSHPFGAYMLPGCTFKRKGGQVRFTPQQTQHLEHQFNSHKYLSPEDRKKLAAELKLSDRQVKTWFQNRRAKMRRGVTAIKSSPESESIDRIRSNSPPTNDENYTLSGDKLQKHNHFKYHVDSTTISCCSPTN